jgi:UDP-N-acetyl-D-mannosaminuronic acid dehydrogenase
MTATTTQSEPSGAVYGSDLSAAELARAFRTGTYPVAVYGLGKMGLPLATVFAETTGNTIGADVDGSVVRQVSAGNCPVENEPGLDEAVADAVETRALRAVSNPSIAARQASVHVVIVPTLVTDDDEPDLGALRSALEDVALGLDAGDLVCVESTVPPGTCRDVVEPLLVEKSGLDADAFGLAFCPERTASGRALQDIRGAYPKVVGGVDDESTRVAAAIYETITDNDVLTVADATTAECVKVFEGVYRDVNIALANELATLADELAVDVTEAIETANTQPYCDLHSPGPGVGGHCIPYYPYFLVRGCETGTPLLRTARDVNEGMPAVTARKLVDRLLERPGTPTHPEVLVLGVAYRPGVAEIRESPGLAVAEHLREVGCRVTAVDPVVADDAHDLPSVSIDDIPYESVDGVVLATAHDEFAGLDWDRFGDVAIVDGHRALPEVPADACVSTIGRPDR